MSLDNTPRVIALGNFDGVHLGHRAILRAARESADAIPGASVLAWTFAVRHDSGAKPVLTPPDMKTPLLLAAGADEVEYADFTALRDFTPERFVDEILIEKYNCRAAICGFNYRFGKKGAGDPALLSRLLDAHGARVVTVEPVTAPVNGESAVISSSLIRSLLIEGKPEDAAVLLGRPYAVRLPVIHGRRLGRLLGFPTINQRFPDGMIEPKRGVYVCECEVGSKKYRGVTNIGIKPTVGGKDVTMETHIIGFDGDLYGAEVEVRLLRFLRPEIKFSGEAELHAAIAADVERAKSAL